MTTEHMRKTISDNNTNNPEVLRPDVELWAKGLIEFSQFPPKNLNVAFKAIQEAVCLGTPLPFSLAFCPADRETESPTSKKQKFEFIPLTKDLPRAKQAIEELFGFLIFTKKALGMTPQVFLVFADSLERGIEETTLNTGEMPKIATTSVKGIQELLFLFDQNHPGLLQKEKIPMPKIHKISTLAYGNTTFVTLS